MEWLFWTALAAALIALPILGRIAERRHANEVALHFAEEQRRILERRL